MSTCEWCAGACAGADLGPLLTADLAWLWEQVAARADRTGDPDEVSGRITVHAPEGVAARAAATGLLGGQLRPGQRRIVDLADLSERLTARGPHLTPGAVAAHAAQRPLGVRVQARTRRARRLDHLRSRLDELLANLPAHVAELAGAAPLDRLARAGALARLDAADDPDTLLNQAAAVLHRLPVAPARTDRRTLVASDPHALDSGPLPWLVLAVTARTGVRPARAAWDQLGVDIDTLTGGLLVTGLLPQGWSTPPGSVLMIPSRELTDVDWAPPRAPGSVVWVTENPSVLQAAVEIHPGVAMACLNGTPSAVVLAALGKLAGAGWGVRVRADFDVRGLQHVTAMLDACPGASGWRIGAEDYLNHLSEVEPTLPHALPATPWDPELARVMAAHRIVVYEEDLLGELLGDLQP